MISPKIGRLVRYVRDYVIPLVLTILVVNGIDAVFHLSEVNYLAIFVGILFTDQATTRSVVRENRRILDNTVIVAEYAYQLITKTQANDKKNSTTELGANEVNTGSDPADETIRSSETN